MSGPKLNILVYRFSNSTPLTTLKVGTIISPSLQVGKRAERFNVLAKLRSDETRIGTMI